MSGVRARTAAASTAAVSLALVLGGVALEHVMRDSLADGTRQSAVTRADELVALLDKGITPGDLSLDGDGTSFVQVLDGAGQVVAASADVLGREALAGEGTRTLDPGPLGDGEAFVVVGRRTTGWTVLSGRSLEPVSDATEVVRLSLLVGLPVLTVLVGAGAWLLTGRALRPVEAVRREVAAISGKDLGRRVPVPRGDDEVARLAVTMNEMLYRLETAQQSQRRFVADASHELRTPLAALLSQIETGQVDGLRDQVVRLGALIDDLLLLARTDGGLASSEVDLDDLVLAEASAARDRRQVIVDTTAVGPARVRGDARALARLVRNLVDNAERHARSTVRLALDGSVRLRVDDDGEGVPVTDRERVFERFTRLDDARSRDAGGTGLGLAIVREVARAHGGDAHVVDGGVVVTLPASGSPQVA